MPFDIWVTWCIMQSAFYFIFYSNSFNGVLNDLQLVVISEVWPKIVLAIKIFQSDKQRNKQTNKQILCFCDIPTLYLLRGLSDWIQIRSNKKTRNWFYGM